MKRAAIAGLSLLIAVSQVVLAQEGKGAMSIHARGTFTVAILPLSPAPADGLTRYSINKEMHGDLEATTKGEMFSGGDPKQGVAGYVAIEVVTGTLQGKHGSFALQQLATMDASGSKMTVVVGPGASGSYGSRLAGCRRFLKIRPPIGAVGQQETLESQKCLR
jgi:hypothetical protein